MLKGFWRRKLERELEDELRFHLQQEGASAARFGGVEAIKEECREQRAAAGIWSLLRDVRLGLRLLRRNPGFAMAAVVTLGLAIGANTAVYSCLSAFLLHPPPFPHPERLIEVVSTQPGGGIANQNPIWAGDYEAYRAGAHALSVLAGYTAQDFNLSGAGALPTHVGGMRVTTDFFDVFRVPAAQGRTFLPDDMNAVVLSDEIWRNALASRPMVGRPIELDGAAFTVIGIMPRKFQDDNFKAAVWIPMRFTPPQLALNRDSAMPIKIVGRLRVGATVAQAAAEVRAITRREDQYAGVNEHGWGETVISLEAYKHSYNDAGFALAILLGTVSVILLIACGNIAGLLLERGAARAREFAIRRALGAPRRRLVRQLLTESSLLAVSAGGLGIALAAIALRWLNANLGAPSGVHMDLDPVVLLGTAAAVALTALAAGLGPALRATSLKPRSRERGRSILITAEVALSLASLVLTLTLVQLVRTELQTPLGYQPRGVLVGQLTLSSPDYKQSSAAEAFLLRLRAALAALPGAESAALVSPGPPGWDQYGVQARGREPYTATGNGPIIRELAISPGYFRTLQAPILAGRDFTDADNLNSEPVALISPSAARRLFPDLHSPIGQYVRIVRAGEPAWRKIVGVAPDLGQFPEDEPFNRLDLFEPLLQRPSNSVGILLRTPHRDSLAKPLRAAVARLDPNLPVFRIEGLDNLLIGMEQGDIAVGELLSALALLALLLTAVGLFGMVAYSAARRRREAAIRMALGATRSEIVRWLGWSGWRSALIGIACGLALAWLDSFALAAVVSNTPTRSIALFGWPALALLVITGAACLLPARRAALRTPIEELRQI